MLKSGLHGSAEAFKMLKELEPEVFKAVKQAMRVEINPIIKPIQSKINSQITASMRENVRGMFHSGKTSWDGVSINTRVSTRPRDLIFLNATGMRGSLGYNYTELAGIRRRPPRTRSKPYTRNGATRTHKIAGQGDALIEKLNEKYGKPGRFVWIRVVKDKPKIEDKIQQVTNDLGIKISRKYELN